ncbi:MAG TPA: FAD-dependent oxidoreductase [Streptosporangiaceae bacterium]|jgi:D-amino-acid dehydrogenase
MSSSAGMAGRPGRVAVAGAGIAGLCVAWFLQEYGIGVTVFDRGQVAAGASWGNAGWITPALAAPLPEPAILRAGLAALVTRGSPVSVPPRPDAGLAAFLWQFARHCTTRRWRLAMTGLAGLSRQALAGYDALASGGVTARAAEATPLLAAYRTAAARAALVTELREITGCGGAADFDLIDGPAIQRAEPALSDEVRAAVVLHGQRYIDPGALAAALAASVRERGGVIQERQPVTAVTPAAGGVLLRHGGGESRHDAVVLATGAWLGGLARPLGVRTRVQSGRGYSYAVRLAVAPRGPVYFPAARLACTPRPGGAVRIAGIMELRPPGAPLRPGRLDLMAASIRPLLREAGTGPRTEEWAGPRPVTPDGLPVIGQTRSERVFVAGGHGMWGITLGPATGRLLAEQIATGAMPPVLAPFDPLR